MPDKTTPEELKAQLCTILAPHYKGKDPIDLLINKLDDKTMKQLLGRIVSDIENEHWAGTGKLQTIAATVEINIVGEDEKDC